MKKFLSDYGMKWVGEESKAKQANEAKDGVKKAKAGGAASTASYISRARRVGGWRAAAEVLRFPTRGHAITRGVSGTGAVFDARAGAASDGRDVELLRSRFLPPVGRCCAINNCRCVCSNLEKAQLTRLPQAHGCCLFILTSSSRVGRYRCGRQFQHDDPRLIRVIYPGTMKETTIRDHHRPSPSIDIDCWRKLTDGSSVSHRIR